MPLMLGPSTLPPEELIIFNLGWTMEEGEECWLPLLTLGNCFMATH